MAQMGIEIQSSFWSSVHDVIIHSLPRTMSQSHAEEFSEVRDGFWQMIDRNNGVISFIDNANVIALLKSLEDNPVKEHLL